MLLVVDSRNIGWLVKLPLEHHHFMLISSRWGRPLGKMPRDVIILSEYNL